MDSVSIRYEESDEESLNNFSLHAGTGECILLTGASGCGKTTVMRCLNGLIPHFYPCELSGDIYIDDKNLSSMSTKEISGLVGSVFQDPRSQFFTLRVDSEIAFPCENSGMNTDQIQNNVLKAAKLIGIEALLGSEVTKLSSGQKQSVAIASACALKPKVLVLDEPSANLDKLATEKLREILLRLKAEGTTIIISEHKLYWLSGLCDRMILMENGRKKLELSSDEFSRLDIDQTRKWGVRFVRPYYKDFSSEQTVASIPSVSGLNVSFAYKKGADIFKGLSFSLPKNKVIGLTGKNGVGKSTFARLCVGLEKPRKGLIAVGGKAYTPRELLKKSFYVMQDADYQLFSDSVLGELTMGSEDNPEVIKKAKKILKQLDLLPFELRHPGCLSGGQKQRLTIAVAIMRDAQTILFDEPTSGLDGGNMLRVARLLRRLAAEGKTVLAISHDTEFLLEACDSLLYLEKNSSLVEVPISKENSSNIYSLLLANKT